MSKPLCYYSTNDLTERMQFRYGSRLENMPLTSLLTLRAIVATYRFLWQVQKDRTNQENYDIALNAISPNFAEIDAEAANFCQQFCLETNSDGELIYLPHLDPIQMGFTDCILSHCDY